MTDNKCISSCVECVLETDDGRQVFLGADYTIKLFEAQQVDKRHKIQVYKACAEDRSVHMAFHIQMSGKCFLLTVKDGSLKAQQVTRCFPIEDKQFFFRWGGEYGDARTLLWMGQSGSVVQSGGLPTLFKMVKLSEAK